MYKVRGTDGKDYGPVTAEVLRQWIKEGRANAQTLVQPEGSEAWQPVSSLPEFTDVAMVPTPASVAPGPATAFAPAAPPKTSGMAIASLVLGILGLCSAGITSLIGLILGIVALVKIRKSSGQLGGQGLAIAGVCVSGLFLLMLPIQLAILLPAVVRARGAAETVHCVSNVKQIALAIRIYASDHDETLPPATTWCDAIQNELGGTQPLQCRAAKSAARSTYGYNAKLGGLKADEVDPRTVMIFECRGGWNISGGPRDMITHHKPRYVVGFVDGSVQQINEAGLSRLRWDP